jgi:hypothetical protein
MTTLAELVQMAITEATQKERERCLRCVESQIGNVDDPLVKSLLVRIANAIASGA